MRGGWGEGGGRVFLCLSYTHTRASDAFSLTHSQLFPPSTPLSFPPQVKALAPEFYDHLPFHTSWAKVYGDYIFRADICPFNRVKREPVGGKKAN